MCAYASMQVHLRMQIRTQVHVHTPEHASTDLPASTIEEHAVALPMLCRVALTQGAPGRNPWRGSTGRFRSAPGHRAEPTKLRPQGAHEEGRRGGGGGCEAIGSGVETNTGGRLRRGSSAATRHPPSSQRWVCSSTAPPERSPWRCVQKPRRCVLTTRSAGSRSSGRAPPCS